MIKVELGSITSNGDNVLWEGYFNERDEVGEISGFNYVCVCMCACASNAHLPRSFLSGNEQANFVCLIMSCFQKSRNGRRCE